jgi:four helix bundle protein
MKGYRDLEIYNLSFELAVSVHHFTLKLPKIELFETGSQLRRATKSVGANIVEGFGRRKYKAEFIRFVVIAHASCEESIYHLELLSKIYHEKFGESIQNLIIQYTRLSKMIYRFIDYLSIKR